MLSSSCWAPLSWGFLEPPWLVSSAGWVCMWTALGGLLRSSWDMQLVFPAPVPSPTCRAHQWGVNNMMPYLCCYWTPSFNWDSLSSDPIWEYSSTGNEFLSLWVHPLSPVLGLKTAAGMKDLKSCVRHRSVGFSPSLWLATSSNQDWSYETPQRHWIQYSLMKTWKDDANGSPEAKIWACKKPIKRTWAQGCFLLVSLYS